MFLVHVSIRLSCYSLSQFIVLNAVRSSGVSVVSWNVAVVCLTSLATTYASTEIRWRQRLRAYLYTCVMSRCFIIPTICGNASQMNVLNYLIAANKYGSPQMTSDAYWSLIQEFDSKILLFVFPKFHQNSAESQELTTTVHQTLSVQAWIANSYAKVVLLLQTVQFTEVFYLQAMLCSLN